MRDDQQIDFISVPYFSWDFIAFENYVYFRIKKNLNIVAFLFQSLDMFLE